MAAGASGPEQRPLVGEIVTREGLSQESYDPRARTYTPQEQYQHQHSQHQHQPYQHQQVQPYQQSPWTQVPPSQNVFVVTPPKSVAVAFLLTFFFGCFGMFYSTVTGALIMLAIAFFVGVIGAIVSALTFGIGAILFIPLALLIWPASILWGCLAASNHNAKLRPLAMQAGHHPVR